MNTLCAESLISFEEYLNDITDADERYELHDGVLVAMSPPTLKHILIAKILESLFEQEAREYKRAFYCLREVGVRTGYRKVRLLDVAVFEKSALQGLLNQSAVFEIAPLLAVEVVSQESIQRDYRHKRSEYAAMGISEYWIVDPLQDIVSILNLIDGCYELQSYTGEHFLVSTVFPNLAISAAQIFDIN